MSSYIIAGSADSIDTAYCEEIARKIKAKYKNVDFRVVIKHPKQWDDYLNQICRIYGFLNKSNPIIYTYHGKIIGNKEAFLNNTVQYFGLEPEDLNIENLTTRININLAEEEIKQKHITANNILTLPQKIDATYKKLLQNGTLRHQYKDKEEFLVNGIEYCVREVEGLCPAKKFAQEHQVAIEKQSVEAQNIDLMALSLQDQIQPQEGAKDAFVTNNQALNTESMEKMSEASRTNKIQSSVISKDGDSKHNKESNKEGQKIDEQFDDVADFTDTNMEALAVCELGDNFYLSYRKASNSHISGEMLLYHSEVPNSNCIRAYNDGRAVIGHRTLVKEIHYIHDDIEIGASIQEALDLDQQDEDKNGEQKTEKKIEDSEEKSAEKPEQEAKKQQTPEAAKDEPAKEEASKEKDSNAKKQSESIDKKSEGDKVEGDAPKGTKNSVIISKNAIKDEIQKYKTDPLIPEESKPEEMISEPDSDLNLISNLNYHTLYILKPLSQNQLKMILYTVRETNCVACLQFLPENPNPKIKVYNRGLLLESKQSLFPVEKFIQKQIEDGQVQQISLVPEDGRNSEHEDVKVNRINDLNYSHFYLPLEKDTSDDHVLRALKLEIDELLNLEQDLKKQIGYNIIFAKDYILAVALTEPYKVYGSSSLYFDGLAYLGYVHLARVVQGYTLKAEKKEPSEYIPELLARCSGFRVES